MFSMILTGARFFGKITSSYTTGQSQRGLYTAGQSQRILKWGRYHNRAAIFVGARVSLYSGEGVRFSGMPERTGTRDPSKDRSRRGGRGRDRGLL